ncbi:MAG: heme exporter protein CcmD [Terricaulis sp.]
MVTDAWPYIWAAYVVTVASLGVLTLVVVVRAARWGKLAKRQAQIDRSAKEI